MKSQEHRQEPVEALRIVGQIEVAKLRLQKDDVLLVRMDRQITQDVAKRVREVLDQALPKGVKTLVIDSSIAELSVVSATELAAQLEAQRKGE